MKNKVAYITGGSKGIGLGIAEALIAQGMKVAISSRNSDEAKENTKHLPADQLLIIKSDVTKYVDEQAAIAKTIEKFGSVDVLIANAGIGKFGAIDELTEEDWHSTIDTNLTGVFHTVKAGLDAIKKSEGYIITIASLAGTNFFAKGAAYNASKFGLVGFTQAIMLDLREYNVKVSTIMPGSVSTYFAGHTPSEADAWKIQPEDIGKLVTDLLSMNPRTLPSKIEVRPSRPDKK